MRKGILFKKGIIIALAAAMATASAPIMVMNGWGVLTAKAEETESHNYNAQGFCTECDAYQPATLTSDKYDIDGDGTKDNVYEISNAGCLYWFSDKVLNDNDTYGNVNAVLTDDIVVNENVLKSDGTLNEGTYRDWIPIGTFYYGQNHVPFAAPYSGIFDGQDHTISGLYLKKDDDRSIGLFGCIEEGKIYNVSISDSYFSGATDVGGICGKSHLGTVVNCHNAGTINGTIGTSHLDIGGICGSTYRGTYIGGICGVNFSGISYCNSTGTVAGSGDNIGGICGEDNDGKGDITNCYYDSSVYTGDSIGDKYAYGDITGKYENVEGKTTEQYKSGEVAYLLQDGQTEEVWGQTVGTDTYPVLHGAKVYKNNVYSRCNDLSDVVSVIYNNDDKPVYGDHDFVYGECIYCEEKAAATVTINETTTYYQSLQDAIDYAEKMPGSVVTAVNDMNDGRLNVDSSEADFTIDINGYDFSSGIAIKEGKITITDSRTGGDIVDEIEIYDNATVTIGDVKISGDILSFGNLVLNGGDLHYISLILWLIYVITSLKLQRCLTIGLKLNLKKMRLFLTPEMN